MDNHKSSHIVPKKNYLIIGGVLLTLTAVTVAASFIDLGSINIVIALAIASVKAGLVALFFMHLYYDNKLYLIAFATSIFFLSVLISLTIADTMRRGEIYEYRATPINRVADMYNFLGPGAKVFAANCGECHVLEGEAGLPNQLSGLNAEFVYEFIDRLEFSRFPMNPFSGTDEERRSIADFLYKKTESDHIFANGEEAFNKRCGFCHTKDGDIRPLFDSFYGSTHEDVYDLIPLLLEQIEFMVQWFGTDEELLLISKYIASWYDEESGKE